MDRPSAWLAGLVCVIAVSLVLIAVIVRQISG